MSFVTWYDYGYGICTSYLKIDYVERIHSWKKGAGVC